MSYQYSDITEKIIEAFYKVYNILGYGFLEKVYQNALYLELKKQDFYCETQKQIKVFYEGNEVGIYYPDIIINNTIILELKAAEFIAEEHEYQLINYLKATNIEVGLLLNFGKKPEIRRKVFSNINKKLIYE